MRQAGQALPRPLDRGVLYCRRELPLEAGAVVRVAVAAALCALLALGVGASDASPAKSDQITLNLYTVFTSQPGLSEVIPNFERVYPNITINATYAPSSAVQYQVETTELAAGDAPDLIGTEPGCASPVAVCQLARSGYLAAMLKKPWTKRSLPIVTSLSKYGQGLFAFDPTVSPYGVFTNDELFKKLGLTVPQTFAQLLDVCQKAKAAGTVAVQIGGIGGTAISNLLVNLAVATVYGKDPHWGHELRTGTVSFDGTAGWHEALQEFIDMSNAGCFEPGLSGTTSSAAEGQFAQGQGLMWPTVSGLKGTLDKLSPQFAYTFHPFAGGTSPNQTATFLFLGITMSVNAHSSAENQAAAQTFIDFIARPKQNADWSQAGGGLTQYEFLKGQIPAWESDFAPVFERRHYVVNPQSTWWNANVPLALNQDGIGLVTGQETIDDVLNAMDAAWKQGPS
jgi:raffinose/stachyose/melibiose transport system substrate-binding protein